jgi:uncharacterized protein (TIGR00255 family)
MIRSMTAFSTQSIDADWGALVWEIRTVNHRYLDVIVRMPEELRCMEVEVRDLVSHAVKRGKVECNLRFKPNQGYKSEIEINESYAAAVIKASQVVTKVLHQPSEINAMDVLKWPGVVKEPKQDLKPVLAAVIDLAKTTLEDLIKNRESEGKRLEYFVMKRRESMIDLIHDEIRRRPEVVSAYRKKLMSRLDEIKAEPDMDRFEQELVYLTQKMDVDEELDRLESHMEELKRIFSRKEPIGRRLDFIMQELNREANTLGSKSVDIHTTQASVELKVLIEQMREQVQNIE